MKNVYVTLMVLALFNQGMARRILTDKADSETKIGTGMSFDMSKMMGKIKAITNASQHHTQTSSATTAVGVGKTVISGSIGPKGAINNVNASKGGHAQTSFNQVGSEKASSSVVEKDSKGNLKAVNTASGEDYATQGANESAFEGSGNSSTGISKEGVVNNVKGDKAAAATSSFNGISKGGASASSLEKHGGKTKKTSTKSGSSSEAPVADAPVDTSADAPAEDAPADAPAEDAPAEDAPADVPAEEDTGAAQE